MRSTRTYHPFSTARSRKHIVAILGILLIPFFTLLFFSYVANITLPSVLANLSVSLWRIGIAALVSIILGWTLAVLFYKGRRGTVALPVFDLLQSFPTSAALPIAVLYLGAKGSTVIFFLILSIIWPIFFSILSSLRQLRHDWVEVVSLSGIRRFDYMRLFLIPVTTPALVTGTIIGLGDGWEALVATEIIVGTRSGLGNFFNSFGGNAEVTLLGIIVFLTVIFAINKIIWLPLLDWSHHITEE
ncbi:MAG: ABC transporter permease subunit [Candidatus Taylorbacteria bacterium]